MYGREIHRRVAGVRGRDPLRAGEIFRDPKEIFRASLGIGLRWNNGGWQDSRAH